MNATNLDRMLRDSCQRTRLHSLLHTLLAGSSIWLAVLLAVTMIDAGFGLPASGLIVLDMVLVGVAIGIVIAMGRQLWRHRYHPRRMARMVEQKLDIQDSYMINTIDLAAPINSAVTASCSTRLVEYAIACGDRLAATLEPVSLIDRQLIIKALKWFLGSLIILVFGFILAPRLFNAVWARLLNPVSDLPPFTLVQFDVTVQPEKVMFGSSAKIQVRLTGPTLPDRASVIFIDHNQQQKLPMMRVIASTNYQQNDQNTDNTGRLFSLYLEKVDHSRTFFIDTPAGRSKQYELVVLPVPLFEKIDITYDYPTYTNWPDESPPFEVAQIKALKGTRVSLSITSNVPLDSGQLTITPPHKPDEKPIPPVVVTLKPDLSNPNIVHGSWRLLTGGSYQLALTGIDGTPGLEPLQGQVKCIEDQSPTVEIVDPDERVIVPEGWTVDVQINAEDDVGLSRLTINRAINRWGPYAVTVPMDQPNPAQGHATYQFDLKQLGAKAGDLITYFATVYDNDPSFAHQASTPIYSIQVISMEQYLEFARTKYRIEDINEEFEEYRHRLEELATEREQLLEELLKLKDRLDNDKPLTEQERQHMENLENKLDDYQQRLDQLAQDLEHRAEQQPLYEFEKQYQQSLKQLADSLKTQSQLAKETQSASGSCRATDTPDKRLTLKKAIDALAKKTKPFDQEANQKRDQVQQDLEKLRLANDMMAETERINSVITQQRELADRLAQYRHKEKLTPAEQRQAQKLAKQQEQLRQELDEAVKSLSQLAKEAETKLPKMSGSAQKICKAISDLQIQPDQQNAERQANAGHGRNAHQAAESAAEKLESLRSNCKGMQGQGQKDLDGCLKLSNKSLSQSMAQMAQSRGIPGMGKQGGDGSGYSGSMARMRVIGPAGQGKGDSQADRMIGRRRGGNKSNRGGAETMVDEIEHLEPDQVRQKNSAGMVIPGVPASYREEAEAYFRRLADDNVVQ